MIAAQSGIVLGIAAAFGAVVGSFLNVCIYRLPRPGLSVNRPRRSFCPNCGFRIPWRDNLPVVGWLMLGGRCRGCREPIAARYPLVEAATAALFALVAYRHGIEGAGSWGGTITLLVLAGGLIVAAFTDIDTCQIPDEVTVGGMHLWPLAVLLFPDLRAGVIESSVAGGLEAARPLMERASASLPAALHGTGGLVFLVGGSGAVLYGGGCLAYRAWRRRFLAGEPHRWRDVSLAGWLCAASGGLIVSWIVRPDLILSVRSYALASSLLGMLAGSVMIYAVGVVGTLVFRKPAMGFGDVKLMGLLGGLTGWSGAVVAFFVACLLGSIVGVAQWIVTRAHYIRFGPFLCIAAFSVALWPGAFDAAWAWYLALLGV